MSNIAAVLEQTQQASAASPSHGKTNTVPPLNGHPTKLSETKMTPSAVEVQVVEGIGSITVDGEAALESLERTISTPEQTRRPSPSVLEEKVVHGTSGIIAVNGGAPLDNNVTATDQIQFSSAVREDTAPSSEQLSGGNVSDAASPLAPSEDDEPTIETNVAHSQLPLETGESTHGETNGHADADNAVIEPGTGDAPDRNDEQAQDDNVPNRISELLRTRLQAKLHLGGNVAEAVVDDDDDGDDENNTIRARGGPGGKFICYKQELGSGAYKTVYKGMNTEEAVEVAWNEMKVQKLSSGEKRRLDDEVELLEQLRHKNLVRFFGSWTSTENSKRVFITELMTSGTLKQFLRHTGSPKTKVLQGWCRQILNGLKFMHDKGIIHRDIKCDNIFIEGSTGEVKIGDLGLATILKDGHPKCSVIGTPEFMAPEMYREDYGFPIDIWAFGMCVLEMLTLEYPYSECSNAAQIYRKVTQGIKPAAYSAVTGRHSKVRQDFILLCIAHEPEDRASIPTLLTHDFFKPVGSDGQKRIDKKNTTIDVGQINEDGTVEMILRKYARHDPTSKKKILFNMDVFNEDVDDVVQNMIKEGLIAESDSHSIGNHLRVAVASAKSEVEERSASQSPPSGRAKSAPPHNAAGVPDAPPIADFLNGFGGSDNAATFRGQQRRRSGLGPLPEDDEHLFANRTGSGIHEQRLALVNGVHDDVPSSVIAQQQEVLDTYAAFMTDGMVPVAEADHHAHEPHDGQAVAAEGMLPSAGGQSGADASADPVVMQQQLDHLKEMIDRQERLLAAVVTDGTASTDAMVEGGVPSPSYAVAPMSFPLMTTNQVSAHEPTTDTNSTVDGPVPDTTAYTEEGTDEIRVEGEGDRSVEADGEQSTTDVLSIVTPAQAPSAPQSVEDDSATVDAHLLLENEVVYLSDDTSVVVEEVQYAEVSGEQSQLSSDETNQAQGQTIDDTQMESVEQELLQQETNIEPEQETSPELLQQEASVQSVPVEQQQHMLAQGVQEHSLSSPHSETDVQTTGLNQEGAKTTLTSAGGHGSTQELPMVNVQDGHGGHAGPAISLESIPSQSELELAGMPLRDDCSEELLKRLLYAKIRTGREQDIVDFTFKLCKRLHKSEAQNKKAKNAEALSGAMEQNFLNAFSLSGPAPVNKGLGHGGKKLL